MGVTSKRAMSGIGDNTMIQKIENGNRNVSMRQHTDYRAYQNQNL